MNVDLPPLSAFTPDPAVARIGSTRDTLTLALKPKQATALVQHELMSGTVLAGSSVSDGSNSYRVAIAPSQELLMTITF